ncbi:MAG: DegV family protein [Firmicutes bacterium]|nr:DegV family protein [Bacillota bacterium]
MKIKIISDSTCDLTPALLEQHNITVVPLTVIKGSGEFKDGVTITPADIFAHADATGELCSTAAVSFGEFQEVFSRFHDEYDGIILIDIGSDFSACYQNACLAAEDFPKVRVVDSRNLSTGQGMVVLEACRLAETCDDLDEIVEKLNAYTPKVEISFMLDRLDYMVKGGRCSTATALGANLLNIKPCLEVQDGKLNVVKKYRGRYDKSLVAYTKDRLDNREEIDRTTLFLVHSPVKENEMSAVRQAIEQYGHFDHVYETIVGSTVSCHCGPGTLGLVFARK